MQPVVFFVAASCATSRSVRYSNMNHFILTLLLTLLSLIWPLSILQASSCGGNRNIGFSGNFQPFEIPAVDEIVPVDEFTLKVNRVKWSIQTMPTKSPTAVFRDKNTTVRALRLPPLPPGTTLRDLAFLTAPSTSHNMRLENIRTTFAVSGVKASYGGSPNVFSQNLQLVRYYFQQKSGQILCFEVQPTTKSADWYSANHLILNTLEHRNSDMGS